MERNVLAQKIDAAQPTVFKNKAAQKTLIDQAGRKSLRYLSRCNGLFSKFEVNSKNVKLFVSFTVMGD